MSIAEYTVVFVEVLEHLRLAVRFRDGLTGEVVFKESHLSRVFEPLKDPAFFASVSCADGFVEWPGEIELAPDAMYEEISDHGTWILD
ncbi:MAG TPA: DUF2442 domain-containing protein [Thermoanaerobaculia bacterium]|jgi:hypothetical protein|nr:DUF2442 domain-containing protein [Thermoanaerobaculia bacterium]